MSSFQSHVSKALNLCLGLTFERLAMGTRSMKTMSSVRPEGGWQGHQHIYQANLGDVPQRGLGPWSDRRGQGLHGGRARAALGVCSFSWRKFQKAALTPISVPKHRSAQPQRTASEPRMHCDSHGHETPLCACLLPLKKM